VDRANRTHGAKAPCYGTVPHEVGLEDWSARFAIQRELWVEEQDWRSYSDVIMSSGNGQTLALAPPEAIIKDRQSYAGGAGSAVQREHWVRAAYLRFRRKMQVSPGVSRVEQEN
jgi:hypothetical protein